MSKVVYLVGSLRNPAIPEIGNQLREAGYEVFDDWFAGGEIADNAWRDYEKARGHTYTEALKGYAAKHVFDFDKHHLDRADIAVLVLPAGKSAHLELGYMAGKGKKTYVLFDGTPERYDVMYQFATGVATSVEELIVEMTQEEKPRTVAQISFDFLKDYKAPDVSDPRYRIHRKGQE